MGSKTIKDPIIVLHSEAIRYPVTHHLVTGDIGIQHPDYLERPPIDVIIFRVAIFRPESYKHHPATTRPDVHIEVFFSEVVPPATTNNRFRGLQAFFKWLTDECVFLVPLS